jgi:8-oxo-dGTP pyrophosphatase MutT (NUDIX family)
MPKRDSGKSKKQVAALPVARAEDGSLRVLVITSRETRRFIVPKGWPMKGVKDHRAAEIEAREEAGLIGRAHKKPIGSYLAWKVQTGGAQLVKLKVFLLEVERELNDWKERGQRGMAWLRIEEAAHVVSEAGLSQIILDLPHRLPAGARHGLHLLATQAGDGR